MRFNQSTPPTVEPVEWLEKHTATRMTYQGKHVEIKHRIPLPAGCIGGSRKPITGFSPAQRLALLKKLAIWDWDKIANSIFITLTYPDHLATPSQKERNTHRYLFHRHFENYYQRKIPALWRVEYKPRLSGSRIGEVCPHWHFLFLRERFIDKDHINERWAKTIGETDKVSTDVRGAKRSEAVGMYIAKYCSKEAVSLSLVHAANQNTVGRHYGVLRQKEIPVCDKIVIPRLTPAQIAFLRQYASEFLPNVKVGEDSSFTILGNRASDAISYFVANYLETGQAIDDNTNVKGESPAKSVTGRAAGIGTPAGTFSTQPS